MNRNALIAVVSIAVLLGAVALKVRQDRAAEVAAPATDRTGDRLVPDFPPNNVGRIFLKSAANSVTLLKTNGVWVVTDRHAFPADYGKIGLTLKTIWSMRILQLEPVGPSQLGRLELLQPGQGEGSGTLVELQSTNGTTLATLLLGKTLNKQESGRGGAPAQGRYIRNMDGPGVWLVKDTLEDVVADPYRWITREFFRVERPRSVVIQTFNQGKPAMWKASRASETNDWVLADLGNREATDSAAVGAAAEAFAVGSFNDVVDPSKTDRDKGFDKPSATAQYETFDGFTYDFVIGSKTDDGRWHTRIRVAAQLPEARTPEPGEEEGAAKQKDEEFAKKMEPLQEKLRSEKRFEGWDYLMADTPIAKILKPRQDLLAKPANTPEPSPEPKPEAKKSGGAKTKKNK